VGEQRGVEARRGRVEDELAGRELDLDARLGQRSLWICAAATSTWQLTS
jgi:hypothetical protein